MSVHTCPRCPLRFAMRAELVDHLDHDHHVPAGALGELHYPGAPEQAPLYRSTAADDGVQSVLLIANQTLDGGRVVAMLEQIRTGEEPFAVYVLVPATPVGLLRDAPGEARMDSHVGVDARADDAGVAAARFRLRQALTVLQEAGIDAHGSVGDPNPVAAAAKVMAEENIDEVLLSTLSRENSRWLHADVPLALERRLGLKVTVLSADDADTAVGS